MTLTVSYNPSDPYNSTLDILVQVIENYLHAQSGFENVIVMKGYPNVDRNLPLEVPYISVTHSSSEIDSESYGDIIATSGPDAVSDYEEVRSVFDTAAFDIDIFTSRGTGKKPSASGGLPTNLKLKGLLVKLFYLVGNTESDMPEDLEFIAFSPGETIAPNMSNDYDIVNTTCALVLKLQITESDSTPIPSDDDGEGGYETPPDAEVVTPTNFRETLRINNYNNWSFSDDSDVFLTSRPSTSVKYFPRFDGGAPTVTVGGVVYTTAENDPIRFFVGHAPPGLDDTQIYYIHFPYPGNKYSFFLKTGPEVDAPYATGWDYTSSHKCRIYNDNFDRQVWEDRLDMLAKYSEVMYNESYDYWVNKVTGWTGLTPATLKAKNPEIKVYRVYLMGAKPSSDSDCSNNGRIWPFTYPAAAYNDEYLTFPLTVDDINSFGAWLYDDNSFDGTDQILCENGYTRYINPSKAGFAEAVTAALLARLGSDGFDGVVFDYPWRDLTYWIEEKASCNQAITACSATGVLSTATAHYLQQGDRVRFDQTGGDELVQIGGETYTIKDACEAFSVYVVPHATDVTKFSLSLIQAPIVQGITFLGPISVTGLTVYRHYYRPAQYPTDNHWFKDWMTYIPAIIDALQGQGYEVIINNVGDYIPGYDTSILDLDPVVGDWYPRVEAGQWQRRLLDGVVYEQWINNWDGSYPEGGYAKKKIESLYQDPLNIFVAGFEAIGDVSEYQDKLNYNLAAYLLAIPLTQCHRRAYHTAKGPDGVDDEVYWDDRWDFDIGKPSEDYIEYPGSYHWKREFDNGIILINGESLEIETDIYSEAGLYDILYLTNNYFYENHKLKFIAGSTPPGISADTVYYVKLDKLTDHDDPGYWASNYRDFRLKATPTGAAVNFGSGATGTYKLKGLDFTFTLTGNYIDINGTAYSGTITVPPRTAYILKKA